MFPGNLIPDIAKGLSRYGYKKGDFNFIVLYTSSTIFSVLQDTQNIKQVKKLLYGQIIVQQEEYSGEQGQKLFKVQQQCGIPTTAPCQTLELPLLISYGIDAAINAGLDYHKTDDLINSIRKKKFYGCSGAIKFDSRSNFRDSVNFFFYNEIFDSEGESNVTNKEIYCVTCSIV